MGPFEEFFAAFSGSFAGFRLSCLSYGVGAKCSDRVVLESYCHS